MTVNQPLLHTQGEQTLELVHQPVQFEKYGGRGWKVGVGRGGGGEGGGGKAVT